MNPHISIIIPVLNEEKLINRLLEHLVAKASKNVLEIIIVDGGSQDKTVEAVTTFSNVYTAQNKAAFHFIDTSVGIENRPLSDTGNIDIMLLKSKKGRAKQMNLGANHAKGTILYFLHADSFPPKDFDVLVIKEVNKGNKAGCFRMQFDSNHWWLRLASWLTKFNWRACRGGDQSLFITKSLFDEVGGFDESYIIYEDNIMLNELYKRHEFVVINKKLKTSARMYRKHGIWKLQYLYWNIYIRRWFGADARALHHFYKTHIIVKK